MKEVIAILLILFQTLGFSQERWVWTKTINGQENIEPKAIQVDWLNNIYVLFQFYGTIYIENNNIVSYGNKDILFVKYNENGNLLWYRQIGDVEIDDPKGMIIDTNIYITGSFEKNAVFDSKHPSDKITLHSISTKDAFLAKYDTSGNLLWSNDICYGEGFQKGISITIQDNNDISVLIKYGVLANFGDTLIYSFDGDDDYCVVRFDSQLNYKSLFDIKTTNHKSNFNTIHSKNNNTFISGFFRDTLFVYNNMYISNGVGDICVLKFDNNNNLKWFRQVGNQSDNVSYDSDLKGNKIYVTSSSIDTLVIGNNVFPCLTNHYGIFLFSITTGNLFNWGHYYMDNENDLRGISIAKADTQLVVVGAINYKIPYLLRIDKNNGNKINDEFFTVKNTTSYNRISELAYDKKNSNLYVCGYFSSDSLFVGNDTLVNYNKKDAYVSKYGCNPLNYHSIIQNVTCHNEDDGLIQIVIDNGNGPYEYNWSMGDTTSYVESLQKGNYRITVTDNCGLGKHSVEHVSQPLRIKDNATVNCSNQDSCNGSIILHVTGGNPPYVYLWNDNSTDSANYDLCVNTRYYYTITDNNGCTKEKSKKIKKCVNKIPVIIYPNPASKHQTIKIVGDYKNIFLYNINGQLIKKNFNEVDNLHSGIYIIIVDGESYKLVINY